MNSNLKIKLICLPYAGGTKHAFRYLRKNLPDNIDIISFDYPGHGNRIKEKPLLSLSEIVEDIYPQVISLCDAPYAIYGHSMGAIIACLLARKINAEGLSKPLHLFISGTDAPSERNKKEKKHQLPKPEFIEKIKELGGMPQEVLENEDLLDFFEPILRADFCAVETYQHAKEEPLDIPITVMTGDKEDLMDEDIYKWQEETHSKLTVYKFSGDHFFIFDNQQAISELITGSLSIHF